MIKQEFELLTLGLGGAGKSKLLSKLCGENEEEFCPTIGLFVCLFVCLLFVCFLYVLTMKVDQMERRFQIFKKVVAKF